MNDPTGEIEQLVQDVKSGVPRSRSAAESQLAALKAFALRDGLPAVQQEKVSNAVSRLENGLESARRYDEEAKRLRQDLERAGLQEALSSLSKVNALPTTSLVKPEMPGPVEIKSEIQQRVDHAVQQICARYGQLDRLEDYTSNQGRLDLALKHVEQAGLTALVQKIKAALRSLEVARKGLDEKRTREAERREQEALIGRLPERGPISDLRQAIAELDRMSPQPELSGLWQRKRTAVAQELAKLINLAQSLSSDMDQATSQQSLLILRDRMLRVQNLYDVPQESALVEAAITRCDALVTLFSEVEKTQQRNRRSPANFHQDIEAICGLITSGSQWLSNAHREVVDSIAPALESSLTAVRHRALERLQRLNANLSRGVQPEQVQREMEGASADWVFLTAEGAEALSGLRERLHALRDEERLKREEAAKRKAERDQQEKTIKALSKRGPISELRHNIDVLDQLRVQEQLSALWQQKHDELTQELARWVALPNVLLSSLEQALDRQSVETCRSKALEARGFCDDEEGQRSIEAVLDRCRNISEYFEQIEKVRRAGRANSDDFEGDIAAIRQIAAEKSAYLNEHQTSVADRAIAELSTELDTRRQAAHNRLVRVAQDLDKRQSPSKVQEDIASADWAFLSEDDRDRLAELRRQVQERIDSDESQQVEAHFRKIRDPQQRRRCIEALQQLIEVAV